MLLQFDPYKTKIRQRTKPLISPQKYIERCTDNMYSAFDQMCMDILSDPCTFEAFNLNPYKNLLFDIDDEIIEAEFSGMKETNELLEYVSNILVENDVLENNAIFIYTQDKISVCCYIDLDIVTYLDDEDTPVILSIISGYNRPDLFAWYDAEYNPYKYGLLIEIKKNVWKII